MMIPVGLKDFCEHYPERTFDVGIAEQHALTMAAGLAFTGLHPVVAVYATFLNRAFDQLLMDCAMHKAGVTVVLDRSGITGPDGASHHGMWDMTISGVVPGLHLAAPRDGQQVARAVRAAVDIADAPSVVRFPKGSVADPVVAVRTSGTVDVLAEPDDGDVDLLLVGIGSMATTALAAAEKLTAEGVRVRVVDPVWALPVSDDLVALAGSAGPGRGRRGQRRRRRHRLAGRARPARRRPRDARWTSSASPRSSSSTGRAGRCSTGSGSRRMPSPVASARGWAERPHAAWTASGAADRGDRHEALGRRASLRRRGSRGRTSARPAGERPDVLGVVGVGHAELVGDVPGDALQHPVTEQPTAGGAHVPRALSAACGDVTARVAHARGRQHL